LAYDPLNRLTGTVDAVGATYYGFDAAGQLLSGDGPWNDDTVTYTYNNRLRSSLSLPAPNGSPWDQTYAYDGARRLTNTTSPAVSFGYAYDGTRQLKVKKLTLPNSAYITNAYDSVARLLSTELENSGNTILNSHTYVYNVGSQRTSQTFLNTNYENYTYDNIGQLTSALGAESGGTTNRLQEQLKYAYDAAHNLNIRTNNALVQTFNVNDLNELSNITHTGTLTVAGTTTSPASSVTVNGIGAAHYEDATFAATNFTVTNGDNSFTAIANDSLGRSSTNSVTVNLPATNLFAYDLNGNMLTNGNEVLVWNDENQLVTNYVPGSWLSVFVYDGKFRRRIERDYSWNGSAWVQTNEIHYIYDGNVILQQRNANNLPMLTLTRGNDLSGTLQGAGGIGGLLAMTENPLTIVPQSAASAHSYYHNDGDGNVTMLINGNQAVVAKAEFGPFGDFLSLSGSKANVNPFWFSSKPIHWPSGKYDFLYRWYTPQLDRWLNRDPIAEWGGLNLYTYVNNSPDFWVDVFGLFGLYEGPITFPSTPSQGIPIPPSPFPGYPNPFFPNPPPGAPSPNPHPPSPPPIKFPQPWNIVHLFPGCTLRGGGGLPGGIPGQTPWPILPWNDPDYKTPAQPPPDSGRSGNRGGAPGKNGYGVLTISL
jgi:RHS repeat-associated protein